MKVLMIAPQPFFQPRGTPISVYQRLQGLSSLGYEVDLLTYHIGEDVSIPGVRIYRTPRIPFIKNIMIGPSWPKLFLDLLLFYKTILMLISNRYDIIHSHEEASFFSVILAAIFRTPHLYDMHSILSRQLINFNFGNYQPIIKLFEMLERWVINTCQVIITIGIDLADYVKEINPTARQITIENLPINANETTKVQYSVDELKTKLGLKNKLPVVYTGTFERYQGLDLLFESAKIVKKHNPEASFIIVGGKPHQVEYWQNEIRKNQLEDCVHFIGTVPPEETLAYLEMAEILVSPRTEGLSVPLKIYTYLYSGKPTVATKLMAHTQVLNDETAILVAPQKEAFAEGILKLIQNPDLRQHLGFQARKFAQERYNPTIYLTKLEQIYREVSQPLGTLSEQQSSSPKELLGGG
jgi:glycosyltransferase involved in cell wall biosynthesis